MATRRLRQRSLRQEELFQAAPSGPRWEALPEDVRVLLCTLVARLLHAHRARGTDEDRGEVHDG